MCTLYWSRTGGLINCAVSYQAISELMATKGVAIIRQAVVISWKNMPAWIKAAILGFAASDKQNQSYCMARIVIMQFLMALTQSATFLIFSSITPESAINVVKRSCKSVSANLSSVGGLAKKDSLMSCLLSCEESRTSVIPLSCYSWPRLSSDGPPPMSS